MSLAIYPEIASLAPPVAAITPTRALRPSSDRTKLTSRAISAKPTPADSIVLSASAQAAVSASKPRPQDRETPKESKSSLQLASIGNSSKALAIPLSPVDAAVNLTPPTVATAAFSQYSINYEKPLTGTNVSIYA